MLVYCGPRQGHLPHGLPLSAPTRLPPTSFHGQLNLAPCPGHGASLIVILGSLLISLNLVAPFEGLLSQAFSLLELTVLGGVLLISSLLPILGACPHLPAA